MVVCHQSCLLLNQGNNSNMELKEDTTQEITKTPRKSRTVQERPLYRPPPARGGEPDAKPAATELQQKKKRPDAQVYVPRARRSVEKPPDVAEGMPCTPENHNRSANDQIEPVVSASSPVQQPAKSRKTGCVKPPDISTEEEFNNRLWSENSVQERATTAPPQVTRKISRALSNGLVQPKVVEVAELMDSPDLAELTNSVQSEEIKSKLANGAEEDSWETFYDESGEPLRPDALEELTLAVGKVKILEAFKDTYDNLDIRDDSLIDEDLSHVIEVYDFPSSFRTEDILTALNTPGKRTDFTIKWVDDTHALAVYSSPLAALEALTTPHGVAKVRPLAQASKESRHCARRASFNLQPYKPRPKTNASLARRLVSTALGIRNTQTPEQRKMEREVLADAKAQKRLAAKQREAAWEGTLGAP